MKENIDDYLSHSLKNWAAQHQPPDDIRERLIHRASILSLMEEDNALSSTSISITKIFPLGSGCSSLYETIQKPRKGDRHYGVSVGHQYIFPINQVILRVNEALI